MPKKIIILLTFCTLLSSVAFAKEDSELLKKGIANYKNGNYLGVIQIMQKVVNDDPGSALAFYYMAIAYAQTGNADRAIESYEKVITLSPGSQLAKYSEIGRQMIEHKPNPQKNVFEDEEIEDLPPAPNTDTKKEKIYSEKVEKDLEERNLDYLIEKMNKNKKIDPSDYEDFRDFTPESSYNKMPTQEEIAHAYQTLMKAGINPYQAQNNYQAQAPMFNPEMMQMSMMMNPSGGNNNSGMNNMLPLLMMMQSQGAQGQGGQNNIDPQFLQTMLSNMIMPNMMDFGGSNNNNNY